MEANQTVLVSSTGWTVWFTYFRAQAEARKVWRFIDPDKQDENNLPLTPEEELGEFQANVAANTNQPSQSSGMTTRSSARAAATAAAADSAESSETREVTPPTEIRAPTQDQQYRDQFLFLTRVFGPKMQIYQDISRRLEEMLKIFDNSVARDIREAMPSRCITLREKMRFLYMTKKPNDFQLRDDAEAALAKALQLPQARTNIETWAHKVLKAYQQCQEVESPSSRGSDAAYALIKAIAPRYPILADRWFHNQKQAAKGRGENVRLEDILEELYDRRLPSDFHGKVGAHEAAAGPTLNGSGPRDIEARSTTNNNSQIGKCKFCMRTHQISDPNAHWKNCFLCLPEIKSKRFIMPNDDVINAVNERIKKAPGTEEAIRKWRETNTSANQGQKQPQAGEVRIGMAQVSVANEEIDQRDHILFDSGATHHIFNDDAWFIDLTPDHTLVRTGGGVIYTEGHGTVQFTSEEGCVVTLADAFFCPVMWSNLVSMCAFKKQGLDFSLLSDQVSSPISGERLFKIRWDDNAPRIPYIKKGGKQQISAFPVDSRKPKPLTKTPTHKWHLRLAHPPQEVMNHLEIKAKGVALAQNDPIDVCEICRVAGSKQQISRLPRQEDFPKKPYAVVSFDLFEFSEAYNHDRYLLLFTCRYTSIRHGYFLLRKTDLPKALNTFINLIQVRYGITINEFLSDNEKTVTAAVKEAIQAQGITFNESSPHHHYQNGHSERSGGVVITKARHLRIQSGLSESFWNQAVDAAIYILNRLIRRSKEWKAPIQILNEWLRENRPEWSHLDEDQKIDLRHIRAFGCKAFVMTRRTMLGKNQKLEERAHIGYLVGYISSTQYLIWVPSLKRSALFNSSHVTFDESEFFKDRDIEEMDKQKVSELVEEYEVHDSHDAIMDSIQQQLLAEADDEPTQASQPQPQHEPEAQKNADFEEGWNLPTPQSTPSAIDDLTEGIAASFAKANQAFEEKEDIRVLLTAITNSVTHPLHRSRLPPPPASYRATRSHIMASDWWKGMTREMEKMEEQDVAEIIKWDGDQKRLLNLCWVYAYKFNEAGNLTQCKARLCVRGDQQPKNQLDTAAMTLAARTFRLLMALTAFFDLEAHQYDVVNAFLYAQIDEEIYVRLPPGFERQGYAWKLRKALYGLRRSPLLWYRELIAFFEGLGFKRCFEDSCVVTNGRIIIFFYVDDLVILYPKWAEEEYHEIHQSITSNYHVKDLGELAWFLGIQIIRDRENRKLWLSQESYVRSLLTKYHCVDRKAPKHPIPIDRLAPNEENATENQIKLYQSVVGSLVYPMWMTRPDIAYATSQLSRFLHNPSARHIDAALDCIAFLAATANTAIQFNGADTSLVAMSDASHGDDLETRRSSQGHLIKLFGGIILFKAGKQDTVTTSSTEAELLSMSQLVKEVIAFERLCKELNFMTGSDPITVTCDNQQTLRLLTSEVLKLVTKLRHVDIHNHWLRQEVQKGTIRVKWVPSGEMIADGLTKPLTGQKFLTFRDQLGLTTVPPSHTAKTTPTEPAVSDESTTGTQAN